MAKDTNWSRLCAMVADDDGLPVRRSGSWAERKLYYWNRYVEITCNAMVGHPNWPNGVTYVDLFAGPGVCEVEKTGSRFPGSPLIAANAPKRFTKILLCELDEQTADACETRMGNSPVAESFRVFRGDCNVEIKRIKAAIPLGSLTIAFLDPTGLHLKIDTVSRLSTHGPVDLLILFPDGIDILRNATHYYFNQSESNLDLVLGPDSNWRERKASIGSADPPKVRRLFADIYKDQLRRIAGYTHFADEVIYGPSAPLYRLVYATKHARGLDFWNKSVSKELGGQRRLF